MSPKDDISQATTLVVTCQCDVILFNTFTDVLLCRPVYEYPLHGQWIMMDMDDGYVLWTGIWKG